MQDKKAASKNKAAANRPKPATPVNKPKGRPPAAAAAAKRPAPPAGKGKKRGSSEEDDDDHNEEDDDKDEESEDEPLSKKAKPTPPTVNVVYHRYLNGQSNVSAIIF